MNTISDSLIEKLEELYPKPKPEVATVKEEPVVAKPWVSDYVITTSGHNCGSYAIQSTNSGITSFGTTPQYLTYDENSLMIKTAGCNTYPLPMYVQKIADDTIDRRVIVLDHTMIKESTYCGPVNFKQYIDNKFISLEMRIRDHITQEIDKLKCSPGTST